MITTIFTFISHTKAYFILFILALFMLGVNPFKSQTIAPMDLLIKYPGWQNTHIKIPTIHGERSDILDAKLPIWISAKNDLYKGELPLWNHQRGGKPGLTFTNSLMTPAFFTFALIKDNALAFYLSNLVNVLIGLIGMYLFLRLFLDIYASLFGAFTFMFSGFNTAWFFWAHVDTSIWTPWVFYTTYRYLCTGKDKYLPAITLSMLMLNLGGFPMITVMTYIALALLVFFSWFSVPRAFKLQFSILLKLIGFSILAVLITAAFIYPLAELLAWMGGMKHRSIGSGFHLHDWHLFINPDYYRYPRVETTFYMGWIPVVFLTLGTMLLFYKPHFLLVFGLALFTLSISIAFALIDINTLKHIPIINSSLVTRFIYLSDTSLAIIAASVFHFITYKLHRYKWISLSVIVVLFSIQIIDQKRLFKRFNAPVPAASFYPQTKTLSYLQKILMPYQYTMADSGFLIAGTLGGYGLNDWFAHSFHLGEEKEALRKIVHVPFKTPTAAMFNFSQINLDSPYIDYLNIKAILSTSSIEDTIQLWPTDEKATPCPVLPTHTLRQQFVLNTPTYAKGIKLHLATYGEPHAPSDVILKLQKGTELLEIIKLAKEKVSDNSWANFSFFKARTLSEGNYSVTLSLMENNVSKPLTVWSTPNEKNYPLLVDGEPMPIAFHMTLTKQRDFGSHYKVHHLEPQISLIENLHVQGEAYFIQSLDTNQTISYTYTKTEHLSNTKLKINYTGTKSGWIVMPMRDYPGWIATINGRNTNIENFLGFLPAIKVEDKSEILLTYAPNYSKYLYLLSLFSIFILLYLIRKFRKKDSPSNL